MHLPSIVTSHPYCERSVKEAPGRIRTHTWMLLLVIGGLSRDVAAADPPAVRGKAIGITGEGEGEPVRLPCTDAGVRVTRPPGVEVRAAFGVPPTASTPSGVPMSDCRAVLAGEPIGI
jgi:hypothetical protein